MPEPARPVRPKAGRSRPSPTGIRKVAEPHFLESSSRFIDLAWRGRTVRIEHQWIAPERSAPPLLVFLHEGPGSVAMWRDFPARLCQALGLCGLVYSRPGYGRPTPRAVDEIWGLDFLHRQAHQLLPALLARLGINTAEDKPWLLGHSDGASIALLHAARFPGRVAGSIVLAPH